MGIDVYLLWKGQSLEEREKQYTGFDLSSGHIGYLREAYHGPPYATKILMPEGWDDTPEPDEKEPETYPSLEYNTWVYENLAVRIPAKILRARLPKALETCKKRYEEDPELVLLVCKSFTDFVVLAEKLEAESKEPKIYVSY